VVEFHHQHVAEGRIDAVGRGDGGDVVIGQRIQQDDEIARIGHGALKNRLLVVVVNDAVAAIDIDPVQHQQQ